MAIRSADGRPPPRRLRLAAWRWLAGAATVVVGFGLALALLYGVDAALVMGAGAFLLLFFMLGAWPILTAGALRETEELAARRKAIDEIEVPQAPRGVRGVSRIGRDDADSK